MFVTDSIILFKWWFGKATRKNDLRKVYDG
jgi:hypothetical protein